MALAGRIDLVADVTETVSADLAPAVQAIAQRFPWIFTSGTTTGLADKIWSDTRTLTASASENLDLNGGLTGSFGAVVFAKLKAILVSAAAANTNDVIVARDPSNGVPFLTAAGDSLSLGPGDVVALTSRGAGWTVTAGTGDIIKVTNSAGATSVTYSIILIGTSA